MDPTSALLRIRDAFSVLNAYVVDHDVLAFLTFFGVLYGLTFAACRAGCGLKAKTSSLIGTCACSFVHGLFCIFVGIEVLFLGRFVHDKKLDHINSVLETHMMQFSLAYLLFDTIFSISDPLFLVHHFLSVSYLVSVLKLGVGGSSTVFVFFIGEVTSPVFNSFTVLNEIRREYKFPWALKLFKLVSPLFTFSFIIVRTFVSVPLVTWYAHRLLFDSHAIPLMYRVGMLALVIAGLAGSQVWSWRLWMGWRRSRDKTKTKHLAPACLGQPTRSYARNARKRVSSIPVARAIVGTEEEAETLQAVGTDQIRTPVAIHAIRSMLGTRRLGSALSRLGRWGMVSGVVWLASSSSAQALPLPIPSVAQFQIAGIDATTIEAAVTSAGVLGPVVFVLAYGVAALLLVPASVLTISAGFLFGGLYGTALVSAGSTFGAALSFLVARYFARAFVEDRIQRSDGKILKAVDKAIESQGSKVVFLMRLSPLFPYSLINYSLGLTKIPFVEYIVASWAGMLPGTFAYTGIGAAGKVAMDASVGSVESTSPLVVVLYAVGAIATVLVTSIVGKTASRYLDSEE